MTQNEHTRPLAPGEIRTHTVGAVRFQVMHVAGGAFTQATSRTQQGGKVIKTATHPGDAVRAYAAAIELAEQREAAHAEALAMDLAAAQTESDAIDAIEGDDVPMHFRADGSLHTGLTGVPQDRSDDGVPEFAQQAAPAPALHTPDNPGYGRTVHFEHEGRVVSGTVRGIVFGGGLHRVTVFSADLGHTHTIDHGITVDVADLLPASAPALTDEQRDGWRRELTAEARALAPELFDDTPAPTLADDVTALRAAIGNYGGLIQDWRDDRAQHPGESEYRSMVRTGVAAAWKDIEARLDRIAGAVPQRATNEEGVPIWLHECGSTVRVLPETGDAPCRGCRRPGAWRPLYVLGGE